MEEMKVFEIKPFVFKIYFKKDNAVIPNTNETLVMVDDYEAINEFPSLYPIDSIPSSAIRMKVSKDTSNCKKRTDLFLEMMNEPKESYAKVMY